MGKTNYDRLFLRFLIISLIAIFVLTLTILVSWFFDIELHSGYLWFSSVMLFLSMTSIFTAPFYWKIATALATIGGIAIFLSSLFAWAIFPSLLIGLATVIVILLIYLTL